MTIITPTRLEIATRVFCSLIEGQADVKPHYRHPVTRQLRLAENFDQVQQATKEGFLPINHRQVRALIALEYTDALLAEAEPSNPQPK